MQAVFRRIKGIDIRIEHKESVGIPKGGKELSLSLHDSAVMETIRKPWSRIRIEEPANGIRAMLLQGFHRVYGVALRFTHLLSVLVLYMTEDKHIFKGSLMEEEGGFRKKRVKPTSGLVYCLTDKLCRELGLKKRLIFKRIMMLSVRHGSAVKPAVNDLRNPPHRLSAVRTGHRQPIHIRLMQFDMFISYIVGGVSLLSLRL